MKFIGFFLGIPAKLKLFAVALLGFLAILATVYSKGKTAEKSKRLKDRLAGIKNAQKIKKEIKDADKDTIVDINTRP